MQYIVYDIYNILLYNIKYTYDLLLAINNVWTTSIYILSTLADGAWNFDCVKTPHASAKQSIDQLSKGSIIGSTCQIDGGQYSI